MNDFDEKLTKFYTLKNNYLENIEKLKTQLFDKENLSKKEKQNFIEAVVTCLCGNSFKSMSVHGNLEVTACAACHSDMEDGTKR